MELIILALIAVTVVLAITLLVKVAARRNTHAPDSMGEKWLNAYRSSHPL